MTFSRDAQHSWSRNEKTDKEGKPKLVIVKENWKRKHIILVYACHYRNGSLCSADWGRSSIKLGRMSPPKKNDRRLVIWNQIS